MSRSRLRIITHSLIIIGIIAALIPLPVFAQQQTHTVSPGETLFRIALRYGVSVDSLVQTNSLGNANRILVGQTLIIPGVTVEEAPTVPDQPAPASDPVYHTISRGETLASIARTYGLSTAEITQLNNITNPNLIYSGQRLVISITNAAGTAAVAPTTDLGITVPAPVEGALQAAPLPAMSSTTHVVQSGEHLSQIARNYGISWSAIAQANNLSDPNRLLVGQTLIIPGSDGSIPAPVTGFEQTIGQPYGPTPTITVGKQFVVDLSEQMTYAFENGAMVYKVLSSTGLSATPTVLGDYNIYWKLNSQTMSGPGYYLPGVPYVMYFYQGYALHGTYWHSNFGQPMSHGCVNLPTQDAEWLFNWAEVGTPVHVQM